MDAINQEHTLNYFKLKEIYQQHSLEINTIPLNPYGIYSVYGPLYQSIAVFMYQNECAINIFFKTTTKQPTSQNLKQT